MTAAHETVTRLGAMLETAAMQAYAAASAAYLFVPTSTIFLPITQAIPWTLVHTAPLDPSKLQSY